MALIKAIPTEFGIDANYHHIGAVQEDFRGRGTEVTLYGYASAEARAQGRQPMLAAKVTLTGADYIAGADRAALYEIIKQRPEFAGAVDA